MLKKILIAGAVIALIAGCKGKQKATDESAFAGKGGDTVDSTPMSFDPQGSDSGNISGLRSINFGYDEASLTSEAKQILRANSEWLKANSRVRLQIEGHCDNRGTIEYNVALGERRANAVKAYLVGLGVGGDRISTISYGEEKPLAMGDSDSDMARNRRANFVPTN